jgi:hypothetical protein
MSTDNDAGVCTSVPSFSLEGAGAAVTLLGEAGFRGETGFRGKAAFRGEAAFFEGARFLGLVSGLSSGIQQLGARTRVTQTLSLARATLSRELLVARQLC